jgi:hypothetical protein
MLKLMTVKKETNSRRTEYSKLTAAGAVADQKPKQLPSPLVLALRAGDGRLCAWNKACAKLFVPDFLKSQDPARGYTMAEHGLLIKEAFLTYVRRLRKLFNKQIDPATEEADAIERMEAARAVRCLTVSLVTQVGMLILTKSTAE